jgi:hypothetical protein
MMARQITEMKTILYALLCITGLTVGACFYDVEEVIYPNKCSTDAVTYSNTILPIIQRECYTCHDVLSQNGGVNLEGYDALFEWVANGKMLSSIKHESEFPMPDSAEKLDSCTIAKIEVWINAGAPEN